MHSLSFYHHWICLYVGCGSNEQLSKMDLCRHLKECSVKPMCMLIFSTQHRLPCILIQVSRLAGVLVKNGVRKGDLVVIYMPMVPQAMFTMLACARIGAPHSLIFGGFASKELSVRIDHAKVRKSCYSPCG